MSHSGFQDTLALLFVFLAIVLLWRLSWYLLRAVSAMLRRVYTRAAVNSMRARANSLGVILARRAPRTMRFVAGRLNPRQFQGLPLTLMILAAIYVASLLGGLVEELMEAEELVRFDTRVNQFLNPYRSQLAVSVFDWITGLGAFAALTAVVFVSTGFFWAYRHAYLIAALWISFLGAQITTYAGKFSFARERPEFLTDVTALTPSFPSGHATGAMAVYGFVAYAVARDLPTLRQRFEVTYWTLVLIGLVGMSRIFLSVHYTSDVAAGILVGGFWLLAGFAVAEQFRSRAADSGRHQGPVGPG